jgi:hypothetical protein
VIDGQRTGPALPPAGPDNGRSRPRCLAGVGVGTGPAGNGPDAACSAGPLGPPAPPTLRRAGAAGRQPPIRIGTDAGAGARSDGRGVRLGVDPELLAMPEKTLPMGRGGTPQDAAGAVVLPWIPASDHVGGQTLRCGGGLTEI